MNTHADKTQENKSRSFASAVSQRHSGVESAFQLADNRPEAIQMQNLEQMANNSPRVKQLKAFQEMADNGPKSRQSAPIAPTAQLQVAPTAQLQVAPTAQLQVAPTAQLQVAPTAQLQVAPTAQLQVAPTAQLQVAPTAQLQVATVQRYAVAQGGGNISQNSLLLVRNPQTAFAAQSRFLQANAIGGQVQFNQGDAASAPYENLREIVAVAREGSDLAQQTAGFDVQGQQGAIRQRARENYYPTADTISDGILGAMEEDFGEDWEGNETIEAFFGTTDYGEIADLLEPLAEMIAELLPAFGNYDESGIDDRIDQYMDDQGIYQDRALMPSDCGLMARYITGNDAFNENPVVAPGNTYGKPQNLQNREAAEWEYHFAAIIMTDGTDHLTMENAGAKKTDGFNKAQFDKTWIFEMYGPNEGQTFADKYNTDLGY